MTNPSPEVRDAEAKVAAYIFHGEPHHPPYVIVDVEPRDGEPLPDGVDAFEWTGRTVFRHMRGEPVHTIEALLAADSEYKVAPGARRTVFEGEKAEQFLVGLHADERGEAS